MKKLKTILIACFLFFIANTSFGQDSSKFTQYEYMTIISEFPGQRIYLVYITHPDGKVEKIEYELSKRKEYKLWETTVLIKLLEKYSLTGWQIKSSNLTRDDGTGYFYYLLYREKLGVKDEE